MKGILRALVVEDSEADYELLVRALRKIGYDLTVERVETPEAMAAALTEREWDIVFSDWSLPRFSALVAFEVLKASARDIPFIIVSGTVGEDTAVEALKGGAHDFLVKDKLARLAPAVERELREAGVRRERDRMHQQLMISDRMASVGVLAAGVAHEINNPLACIIGNLELSLQQLGQLDGDRDGAVELSNQVRDAREAAERIRQIVRDVRIFSRAEDDRKGPVDVQQVIESSLRMAWNEVRHRARVIQDYETVPTVTGSESRLAQVFLNLIVNAAQAIPEGQAEHNEIRIRLRALDGKQVQVEVADSGPGMSPETLKKLFTPFFTTKPAGLGTGLGLTICRRIVAEFGGTISAESEVGVGTVFRVVLPAGVQDEVGRASPEGPLAPARRRGRVLVVDDEPMVVTTVRRILAAEHDVTSAASAADALAHIEAGERYDVILSDLMMPQMTGVDFHLELIRRVPEQAQRVVFLTGGAFTQTAREYLDRVSNACVEKPFRPHQLRATVNERIR